MRKKIYIPFFLFCFLHCFMNVFSSEVLQRDMSQIQQRHSLTQAEKELLVEYVLRQPFRNRRLFVQEMLQGAEEKIWQYLDAAAYENNGDMLSDIEEPEYIASEKGVESSDIFAHFADRIRFRDFPVQSIEPSFQFDASGARFEDTSSDSE